jgi:hypothetical protein
VAVPRGWSRGRLGPARGRKGLEVLVLHLEPRTIMSLGTTALAPSTPSISAISSTTSEKLWKHKNGLCHAREEIEGLERVGSGKEGVQAAARAHRARRLVVLATAEGEVEECGEEDLLDGDQQRRDPNREVFAGDFFGPVNNVPACDDGKDELWEERRSVK